LESRRRQPTAVELFDILITAWFEMRFGASPHQGRLILLGFNLDYHPHDVGDELFPSDPFARRFLAAVARAEPAQTQQDIHWAYHAFTGSLVYFMTSGDRVERLSGAFCDVNSQDEVRKVLLQQVRSTFPPRKARRAVGADQAAVG
jgi:hypothetical protein